jgi:hypothetical protein
MNKQVKQWLEKSKSDKDFTKNLAQQVLSDVIGKKSPSSLKIKVKFDKAKSKPSTKRTTQKKERII